MLQKCLQSEKNVVRYKIRKVIIGGIMRGKAVNYNFLYFKHLLYICV